MQKATKTILKILWGVIVIVITFFFQTLFLSINNVDGNFLFFLFGINISAFLGGAISGISSTFLSLFLLEFFMLEPIFSLDVADGQDVVLLLMFLVLGVLISLAGEYLMMLGMKARRDHDEIKKIRSDLEASVQRIGIVLDSITDSFISIDSDWIVRFVNSPAENLLGLTENDVIGRDFHEIFLKTSDRSFEEKLTTAFINKKSLALEHFFEERGIWLFINAFSSMHDHGMLLYLKDITEDKLDEERSKQNEAYYMRIIESNMLGIILVDLSGEIFDANEAFLEMLGYSYEDIEEGAVNLETITPEKYRATSKKKMQQVKDVGVSETYRKEYIGKDGKTVPVLVGAVLLNAETELCMCFVIDLTREVESEQKINEYGHRIVNILESLTDAFIALDHQWKFTYVNYQAEKLLKTEKDALIGNNIWEVFPDLKGTDVFKMYQKAMKTKQTVEFEYLHPVDGNWFEVHIYSNAEGLAIYYNDITDRKVNEKKIDVLLKDLQSQRRRLDSTVNNIPGIVWETWFPEEQNLHRKFVSPYLTTMTGYLQREWLTTPEFLSKITYQEDRFIVEDSFAEVTAGAKAKTSELRLTTSDNRILWVESRLTSITDSTGKVVGLRGIIFDISEAKKIQEQLRSSLEQLEIILSNVANGIIVQNQNLDIIYVNDVAARMPGFENPRVFMQSGRNVSKKVSGYEQRDQYGRLIKPEDTPWQKAHAGKLTPDLVINFYHPDLGKNYWYHVKSRPIFDEKGNVLLTVTILSDVTETQEIDKKKDEFMSIASHELKTPITTIKAFTQILLQRATKQNDEQSAAHLSKMEKQVNNLTNLVSDLLDVSRIEGKKLKLEKEVFAIDELLSDTINNLDITYQQHTLKKIGSVDVNVKADKSRIEQVLINLINNAVKYSPDATEVEISVRRDKKKVIICIQDYGVGIEKAELKRIFERFYISDKNRRNRFFGLGLGLYISSQIIKRHHGEIWVESELGKGSSFYFSLPIYTK